MRNDQQEAGQADLHLLEHRVRRAPARLGAVARHEEHQLACRVAAGAARRPRRAGAAARAQARSRPPARCAPPRAPRARRPPAPARASRPPRDAGGGRGRRSPRRRRTGRSPAPPARAGMFSRSVTLRAEQVGEEVRRRRPRSRARARASDRPPGRSGSRRSAAATPGGGAPRARSRSWPTRSSATRRSIDLGLALTGEHRALVLGRQARDGQHATSRRRAPPRWRPARGRPPARRRAARLPTRPPRRPPRTRRGRGSGRRDPCVPGPRARRNCSSDRTPITRGVRRTCRRTRRTAGPAPRPTPSSVPSMKSVRKPAAALSHRRP